MKTLTAKGLELRFDTDVTSREEAMKVLTAACAKAGIQLLDNPNGTLTDEDGHEIGDDDTSDYDVSVWVEGKRSQIVRARSWDEASDKAYELCKQEVSGVLDRASFEILTAYNMDRNELYDYETKTVEKYN